MLFGFFNRLITSQMDFSILQYKDNKNKAYFQVIPAPDTGRFNN